MFTGLVETTGRVEALHLVTTAGKAEGMSRLTVKTATLSCALGDSVAVNGCCLTVAEPLEAGLLHFDVSRETLSCTSLAKLKVASFVNLERAISLSTRLGGHLVSGHIDCTGEVVQLDKQSSGWLVGVSLPASADPYVIHKGSLCLEGVSLTVNKVGPLKADKIEVSFMLIPTTLEVTTLQYLQMGQILNVELDLVGKYLEKLTRPYRGDSPGQ